MADLGVEDARQLPRVRVRQITRLTVVITTLVLAFAYMAGGLGPTGDFGFDQDSRWQITDVEPGSPADKAGIKVGDTINHNVSLSDREFIGTAGINPYVSQQLHLTIAHRGKSRAVTLVAAPQQPAAIAYIASNVVLSLGAFVFLIIAALLVLLRPSTMTWGFYFTSLATLWLAPGGLQHLPPGWGTAYNLLWGSFIIPAGVVGFVAFCLEFPSQRVAGWRRIAERLLGPVLVVLATGQALQQLGRTFFVASPTLVDTWQTVWDVSMGSFSVAGAVSLIGTYRSSTGLERHRIKWVLLGSALAAVSIVTAALQFQGVVSGTSWFVALLQALFVALPLAVAYAVLRHRIIDVRFVISRALVLGCFAAIVIAAIALIDWIVSTKLIGSRLQTAIYAAAALILGFTLNATRRYMSAAVDALFYRQWHRTRMQADSLSATIRHASSRGEAHDLLAAGVARAFTLASAAVFERMQYGGFVRVAAEGWPQETLWHLLPDSTLISNAGRNRGMQVDPPDFSEAAFPRGVAWPTLLIPIATGKDVDAVLLCGSHTDGSALDPDETRSIVSLCKDVALIRAPAGVLSPAYS